eukprot:COSAG01_NODE_492_length_16335_cov_63.722284_16_plen_152_part_00
MWMLVMQKRGGRGPEAEGDDGAVTSAHSRRNGSQRRSGSKTSTGSGSSRRKGHGQSSPGARVSSGSSSKRRGRGSKSRDGGDSERRQRRSKAQELDSVLQKSRAVVRAARRSAPPWPLARALPHACFVSAQSCVRRLRTTGAGGDHGTAKI